MRFIDWFKMATQDDPDSKECRQIANEAWNDAQIEQDKIIRELRLEIEELKSELFAALGEMH